MTVGNAITATAAMKAAEPGWPSDFRMKASGSGLLANSVKEIAPTADSATSE